MTEEATVGRAEGLTAEERASLDDWWHSDWPDDGGDVLDTLVETVERILAARRETLVGKVRALADEACTAIASASHSHWRLGGAGGTCGACEAASERAKDLRARFRALLDAEGTGEQP